MNSLMTKELLEKIKNSPSLSDQDLEIGVEHFSLLCSLLEMHGDVFRLVHNNCYQTLAMLKSYQAARK